MKTFKLVPVFLLLILASCSTVSVYSDYDKNANFASYKTYAFFKPGIDKVEISDLDKRRILRAIDDQMQAKGFTKSENPDLLVNIFTKAENVMQSIIFMLSFWLCIIGFIYVVSNRKKANSKSENWRTYT